MEWIFYLVVGIVCFLYAGAALFIIWALSMVYNVVFSDIIKHRKAVMASRKAWKK